MDDGAFNIFSMPGWEERTRFNRNEARTIPSLSSARLLFFPLPYLAPSPEFQHYFGKPAAFLVVNELFLVRIICWTEFLLPPTSFPPPSSDRFFLLLLLSLSDPFARFALSISDLLPIFTSRFALPLTRARGAALVKRGENGECNLRARFELFIGEGSSLSEWRGTSHFATHPLFELSSGGK